MQYFPSHKFFICNGQLKPTSGFITIENAGGIYEVLRVINGVPLFPEEHLDRFFNSAEIAGRKIIFSRRELLMFLNMLIEKNEINEGNILISCNDNLKIFFIPHNYPDQQLYISGVVCGVLRGERDNPNVKILQTDVRKMADALIQEKGVYEVLLVDQRGRITEGSRSNVFFIKGDELFTPPGNEVLIGVTRNKAIHLAKENKISFKERDILLSELESVNAVFITSTSSKILPVSKIGDQTFDTSDNIIRLLINGYNDLINRQIRS